MAQKDDISRIARLASISLKEDEEQKISTHLQKLLSSFDKISELNTENIEPLFHFTEQLPLREDLSKEPIPNENLTANCRDAEDRCFRLPRVVGEAE